MAQDDSTTSSADESLAVFDALAKRASVEQVARAYRGVLAAEVSE